ncbi:MAG: hypothetical protein M3O50_01060, partial [Myxococcota bacterium]|nr:hypothetical protein [Myxococcota bacterium]
MVGDGVNDGPALADENDDGRNRRVVSPPSRGRPFDWLIFQDPPRHTKLRALLQRAFTPRAIAELQPRVRTLARELLGAALEHGEMNLVAAYAAPLPTLVIAELIGITVEDRARFARWSEAILGLGSMIFGGEEAVRAAHAYAAAKAEMTSYVPALLEARRAAPNDDLLT